MWQSRFTHTTRTPIPWTHNLNSSLFHARSNILIFTTTLTIAHFIVLRRKKVQSANLNQNQNIFIISNADALCPPCFQNQVECQIWTVQMSDWFSLVFTFKFSFLLLLLFFATTFLCLKVWSMQIKLSCFWLMKVAWRPTRPPQHSVCLFFKCF